MTIKWKDGKVDRAGWDTELPGDAAHMDAVTERANAAHYLADALDDAVAALREINTADSLYTSTMYARDALRRLGVET